MGTILKEKNYGMGKQYKCISILVDIPLMCIFIYHVHNVHIVPNCCTPLNQPLG